MEQWFPDAPEHCLLAVGRAIVVSLSNLHLLVKTDRSTRGLACGQDFAFQCRGRHFSPWSGNEDSTCLTA